MLRSSAVTPINDPLPLFPRQPHGHRHGADAAGQFAHDHGPDHLRGEACGEAQMVAEDEGRRHRKGNVDHLSPLVHVFHHAEGGDGVGKRRDQARGSCIVDAQQPSRRQEGPAQQLRQNEHQREGSGQEDGDGAHGPEKWGPCRE